MADRRSANALRTCSTSHPISAASSRMSWAISSNSSRFWARTFSFSRQLTGSPWGVRQAGAEEVDMGTRTSWSGDGLVCIKAAGSRTYNLVQGRAGVCRRSFHGLLIFWHWRCAHERLGLCSRSQRIVFAGGRPAVRSGHEGLCSGRAVPFFQRREKPAAALSTPGRFRPPCGQAGCGRRVRMTAAVNSLLAKYVSTRWRRSR